MRIKLPLLNPFETYMLEHENYMQQILCVCYCTGILAIVIAFCEIY